MIGTVRRRTQFLLYAAILFVLLTTIAMRVYPDGYKLTQNFFSDLGARHALVPSARVKRLALVLAVAACQPSSHDAPKAQPAKHRELAIGKAYKAVVANLDGHNDLVVVDGEAMRVLDRTGKEIARAPVTGGIEVLVAHDHELYAGWGQSRDHMDAKARVTRHTLDHGVLREDEVLAPTTSRQDIVSIIPTGNDLLIAYFESKYLVKKVLLKAGVETDPVTLRMATAWAVGPMGTVVGRLYGDAKGVDGDAFILAPDGTRTPLPTTRGVQGLAIAGTDIFVGDGWHQNYADRAQGLLTWLRPDGSGYRSQLIENTPGQFTIFQIIAADLDGDGAPELVARGNKNVRVYKRTGDRWKGMTIAGVASDVAVGDLDGSGPEIVIVGDHSEVIDLHGVQIE
jgi:hypothetical protein